MKLLAFDLPLVPEQASGQARQVDDIFISLTALCVLIVLGLAAVTTYFLIRYRDTSEVDRTISLTGHNLVEVIWSIIPMGVFIGLFIWGAIVFVHARTPPKDVLNIYVVGMQWYWDLRHEDGPHEVGELHVPLNQPTRLIMTSQDVIHDFAVPAFRTRMDVVPGKYTIEWFEPTKVGCYRAFCDQYCGNKHSEMTALIEVMRPEDYQVWLSQGAAHGESLIETGVRVFQAENCNGCHGANSQTSAPSLENIFGRKVALSDGTFVTVDDQYLRDSILNPAMQVVAGFRPLMPRYQGQISEPDVMALIAYLKSLGSSPVVIRPRAEQP